MWFILDFKSKQDKTGKGNEIVKLMHIILNRYNDFKKTVSQTKTLNFIPWPFQ